MKKLIQTSIVLLLFSSSLLLFQMSCKKEASAQTGTNQNTGLIVFLKDSLTNYVHIVNKDGSNRRTVRIQMPGNYIILPYELKLSSDGSKLIFIGMPGNSNTPDGIYTCNIDGSGVTRILTEPVGNILAAN